MATWVVILYGVLAFVALFILIFWIVATKLHYCTMDENRNFISIKYPLWFYLIMFACVYIPFIGWIPIIIIAGEGSSARDDYGHRKNDNDLKFFKKITGDTVHRQTPDNPIKLSI